MSHTVTFNNANFTICSCGDISADGDTAYLTFNFILIIFLMPVLSSFGIYTNLVNLHIFTRLQMSATSGNLYLAGLSFSDLCVVVTGMFIFCIDSARTYLDNLDAPVKVLVRYILPFGYTAQTCSVYFTVAAAFDCYISTCQSASVKHCWCTAKRALQVISAIGVLSIGYNIVRIWQFEINTCYRLDNVSLPLYSIKLSADNIRREVCATSVHEIINEGYNVYSYMILMTFLPFGSLIVLNTLILRQMKKGMSVRKSSSFSAEPSYTLVGKSPDTPVTEIPEEPENPITMVMVVLLFLACNTLALVINIVENFFAVSPKLINYLADVSNFLVVLNSSVNFVIYMKFGKPYRSLFVSHCCGISPSKLSPVMAEEMANSDFCIPMSQSYITAVTNGSGSDCQKKRKEMRSLLRSDWSPILSSKKKTEAWLNDVSV